jgi:hypothetical protein
LQKANSIFPVWRGQGVSSTRVRLGCFVQPPGSGPGLVASLLCVAGSQPCLARQGSLARARRRISRSVPHCGREYATTPALVFLGGASARPPQRGARRRASGAHPAIPLPPGSLGFSLVPFGFGFCGFVRGAARLIAQP